MTRRTRRWMLFLSVLAALIGCRAFGLVKAAAAKVAADAPRVAPAPQRVAANAQGAEPGPRQLAAAAREVQAPGQEPQPATRKVAKPTESVPSGGCVTSDCHPGIKAMPVTHGPVAADACEACHDELDASRHTFELTETGGDLCESCHELELEERSVHQPVSDGQCAQCHDPHGGQDRFMLRRGGGAATCTACHDDVTGGMPVIHGPVAAGACSACHRGHSSASPTLLVRSGRDLCLECHMTLKKRLDAVKTVHSPVTTDCAACHLPHAAEQNMLLTEETFELCLGCHSQIEDLIDEAITGHGAVSTGKACQNCHNPHGSDISALLIGDMVEVCLSCHDREIALADGTSLMNMRAVLASGTKLHGPIAQRDCVACHQAHGGSNFRLLAEEYPPGFYAPFREESYALCFSCHESELVVDPRTDELTDFRNGDRNLHYLHVNKQAKGRTCRACHETHASNQAKHIRHSVPFGSSGWNLPINFEKTETGGRCSPGCHRPYGYDRVKPVLNQPAAAPSAAPDATAVPRAGNEKGTSKGSRP